jgi:tetratricopeptide (TPR) repeat protein
MTNAAQPAPVIMVEYIRLCIAQGDYDGAEKWLQKLEKVDPDSLYTISLRARILVHNNQRAAVEPRVEEFAARMEAMVRTDQARAALYQGLGSLYASIDAWKLAEKWYRKLYVTVPGTFEPLVASLVQQERITEALEICQKEADHTNSPMPALALIGALTAGKAAITEVVQIERLIQKSLKDHPTDLRLLLGVATLRVLQGKTEEAIEHFRKVVQLNPRHVVALNNLATLLSEKADQRQEALKLIDKAIAVTGSEAALYDTKGTILVLDGQADKALQYLKAAVDGKDNDPRYRFHLALAYRDLKEIEQAKSELEKALKQNLEKEILTPSEQKMLSELRSILTP